MMGPVLVEEQKNNKHRITFSWLNHSVISPAKYQSQCLFFSRKWMTAAVVFSSSMWELTESESSIRERPNKINSQSSTHYACWKAIRFKQWLMRVSALYATTGKNTQLQKIEWKFSPVSSRFQHDACKCEYLFHFAPVLLIGKQQWQENQNGENEKS